MYNKLGLHVLHTINLNGGMNILLSAAFAAVPFQGRSKASYLNYALQYNTSPPFVIWCAITIRNGIIMCGVLNKLDNTPMTPSCL